MQPDSHNSKVSDDPAASSNTDAANIKKRRSSSVKKKRKTTAEPIKAEPVKLEPVGATAAPLLSETRSPGPYRGKCLYQSRKCENERAVKRNGKPHNLCEEHRNKQNQHQRKFDAKKFSRKRRRGSDSDEDGNKLQAIHTEEGEPVAKQLRSIITTTTHQEAETRTPSRVTSSQPMVSTIRGIFPPPVYAAGGTAPVVVARLPPIAAVHASTSVSSMATEAYPRDHVVYSEYRQNGYTQRPYLQQQQQVSQVSAGYSHSELVAASILVQPQSQPSPSSVPAPRPLYYSNQAPAVGGGGQALTTPRPLPSLLMPPRSSALSPSPYHRVSSGIVSSSAPRFSQVVVTPVSSASVTSVGTTVLPPLAPFTLRRPRTPLSSPNSNKK
ncbi:hypothetical protein PHYSODRAFT_340261 [Phytophthora sojae]|uniref:Uncharacterized protein n=1 Tax=Phytophthora sojae (strain P6497) TaxID=1094619 RepID=G5A9C7_PHYSP|nr:hypothetical protein PHYSODRAFT_340261 [Phytophthora sojae]EGZ08503.1 hypothetical protein PHYSODRAFT_340261 [Phytophthora sojae]|eukprot:XP_009536675.1 hypothetical protein PHYSODRAFT_340261 [Phytophthora sojae]